MSLQRPRLLPDQLVVPAHEAEGELALKQLGGGGKKGSRKAAKGDAFSTKAPKARKSKSGKDPFSKPVRAKRGTNGSDPFSIKVGKAKKRKSAGDAFSVKVSKKSSRKSAKGDAFSVKVRSPKKSRKQGDPFAVKVSSRNRVLNDHRVAPDGVRANKRHGRKLGFSNPKIAKRKKRSIDADAFVRNKRKIARKDKKKKGPETGLFKKGVMPKHTGG
ncbi:MAG: hypothetical protein ACFB10_26135 [Salibacteraceae bacterium]